MSYPLIVQPAPLQQLADVILAARQRRMERRMQDEEMRRRSEYLNIAQQGERRADAQFVYSQQRDAQTDKEHAAQRAMLEAQFRETQRVNQMQEIRQKQQASLQLMQLIQQGLPQGVSLGVNRLRQEAAGNRYLPGTTPTPQTLEQDITAAQGGSRIGLQGAAARAPVSGTANGVTYTPPVINYNPPASTTNRPVGANDRLLRSAARTAMAMIDRMDAAVADDSTADTNPLGASVAEGLETVPVAGRMFRGLTTPAAQASRSSGQNRFHNAQTVLAHTYPSLLRHARNGPQMVQMMGEALGQMSSTADPVARAEKRAIVRNIMNDYWVEVFGEPPPAPGTFLQEVPATVGGRSVGVPGSGTDTRRVPGAGQTRQRSIPDRFR